MIVEGIFSIMGVLRRYLTEFKAARPVRRPATDQESLNGSHGATDTGGEAAYSACRVGRTHSMSAGSTNGRSILRGCHAALLHSRAVFLAKPVCRFSKAVCFASQAVSFASQAACFASKSACFAS